MEVSRVVIVRLEAEWRVLVSAQNLVAVEAHPPHPVHYPHVEVEEPPGETAGKEYGEEDDEPHHDEGLSFTVQARKK